MDAPNRQSVVAKYIALYPDVAKDEARRGSIIDLACADANQQDGGKWGRKSRNAQGTDLNTDAMCWKRTDGKHEIYDAITGSGGSSWDAYGPFAAGENGYWVPAGNVPPPPPPPPDNPPANEDIAKLRAELKAFNDAMVYNLARVEERQTKADARMDTLDEAIKNLPAAKLPKLKVVGKTSAAGANFISRAHTHDVDLPVVPAE